MGVRERLDWRIVKIEEVDPVRHQAICKDEKFDWRYTVRTDILRTKGAAPLAGERWVIDDSMGFWTFAAIIDFFSAPRAESVATFSLAGSLFVSLGTGRFQFPFAATLLGVTGAVNTAPTGADLILDLNRGAGGGAASTIFTTQANRPRILAGTYVTVVEAVPNIVAMAKYDWLTVDIDQVGSTIAGADLTLFVRYV